MVQSSRSTNFIYLCLQWRVNAQPFQDGDLCGLVIRWMAEFLSPPPLPSPPQISPAVMCNWSSPESDGSLQNEIDWQIFQSQPQHFSLEFCFRYALPYWHTYDTTWISVLLLLLLVFSVCFWAFIFKFHVMMLTCFRAFILLWISIWGFWLFVLFFNCDKCSAMSLYWFGRQWK